MSNGGGSALLSLLRLDASDRMPLYRQLENAIRQQILSGGILSGTRLPATRQLARDLGISRLTVKNAYEQLGSEGFLHSRRGAGTFVANISAMEQPPEVPAAASSAGKAQFDLSERSGSVAATKATTRLGGVTAFRPGVPALDRFPRKAWATAESRAIRHGDPGLLGYGTPGGLTELKQQIAIHVRDHRGVQCEPEQIVITSGAQQAFVLIALTLLEPGATVWFEDPGHIGARDAMRLLGANVMSVPVGDDGFELAEAMRKHARADLMFVTPSHQHPLGITMSLNRRMEILEYANQNNCWIIEDDYDSEFRYSDRALPALLALDYSGRVLYTGSFSKSMFPALRLGYLISPPELVDAFTAAQSLLSQNVSPLQQQTLARFMLDGNFNAHIRKMRSLYQQRRDLLVDSLENHLGDVFELAPCTAGMHLVGWLRDESASESSVAKSIWDIGIDCLPVSIYCDKQRVRPGIMFGFACAPEGEIEMGVKKISKALNGMT